MDEDTAEFEFLPATPERWPDLEALFSERGGDQRSCWCMWWRIPRSQFNSNGASGNKEAMKQITQSGQVPGILAYHAGRPVGWCSVAPRQDFSVLQRSPALKPVDTQPVWSIVCFVVSREYRRQGLTRRLIQAAVAYAKEHGAQIVEAYPVEAEGNSNDAELYTGLRSTFQSLGFVEVIHRPGRRSIMRYYVE